MSVADADLAGVPDARPGDPRVNVHTVSEAVFCHRAAVLAAAAQHGEDDVVDSPPRWDYIPLIYSEMELLRRVQSERATRFLAYLIAAVLGCAAFLLWGRVRIWLPFSLGCLAGMSMSAAIGAARRLALLNVQYAAFNSARADEPPVPLSAPVPVSWWNLRRAGFEARLYQNPLVDERWNLAGKPWRVLRRGRQRIPVFRLRGRQADIYPKHRVRIAAYCHLLQTCDGGECPYGIVLFQHGYEGVAIPNDAENGRLFYDALRSCRSLLRGNGAPAPPAVSRCAACPQGDPHAVRPGADVQWMTGRALPVYAAADDEGNLYHSPCGDRFAWIPPHARSTLMELEPSSDD